MCRSRNDHFIQEIFTFFSTAPRNSIVLRGSKELSQWMFSCVLLLLEIIDRPIKEPRNMVIFMDISIVDGQVQRRHNSVTNKLAVSFVGVVGKFNKLSIAAECFVCEKKVSFPVFNEF